MELTLLDNDSTGNLFVAIKEPCLTGFDRPDHGAK